MKFTVQSHFVSFGLFSLLFFLSACGGSSPRHDLEPELLLRGNSDPSGNDLKDALSMLDIGVHCARYYAASGGLQMALKTVQYENGTFVKESRVTTFPEEKPGENILNIYTRIEDGRFIINARLNSTMSGISEFSLPDGYIFMSGTPESRLEENAWTPIYFRCSGNKGVKSFSLRTLDDIVTPFEHAMVVLARREPVEKPAQ